MPEYVTLPSGGSIPGIPGTHAPGRYIIDWLTRTLTPIEQAVERVVEHVEEALHPEPVSTKSRQPKQPVSTPAEPALAPMPTEPVDVPELGTPAPVTEPEQASAD